MKNVKGQRVKAFGCLSSRKVGPRSRWPPGRAAAVLARAKQKGQGWGHRLRSHINEGTLEAVEADKITKRKGDRRG